jgi:hypothetical protein
MMALAEALARPLSPAPALRVLDGGAGPSEMTWWERRAEMRKIVGGCPDHWWNPAAPTTERCTCDRFVG